MTPTKTVRCPQCGRENRQGAKFCSGCGTPLPQPQEMPSPPPPEATPLAPPIATKEAKEAASKLWELVKTVVTVGARTAWRELAAPEPAVEGTVVERLKVEAITLPPEPAFWGFLGAVVVLLVFALSGAWLVPLIAASTTLVLSWLKWRRPYFSPLGWKSLVALFGKPNQVSSWHLKLRTSKGETEVVILGETTGDEMTEGDRVRIWGIFDDKPQTRLRAWKVQVLDSAGQPKGRPLIAPRLFPLIPTLFFLSLGMFLLALLTSLR